MKNTTNIHFKFNKDRNKVWAFSLFPMSEEIENISKKTWARTIENLNKVGYMDGASDGQNMVFQSSFDIGYQQGISFGLELGLTKALTSLQQHTNLGAIILRDQQNINCQMCINGTAIQENIGNLYNIQLEKNIQVLEKFSQN